MKELFEIVNLRGQHADLPFCLATVLGVNGSSYRRPGARMLVDARGRVAGSVSGGCLEKDVISRCHRVLLNQTPEVVIYDTTDQDDWAFGTSLGCEGRIQILIEPLMPGKAWPLGEAVQEVRDKSLSRSFSTICKPLLKNALTGQDKPLSYPVVVTHLESGLAGKAELTSRDRKPISNLAEPTPEVILTEHLTPGTDLILLGGGWDAPPLVRLGKELGYRVVVVDRRPAFAEKTAFPQADEVLCLPAPQADGKPVLNLSEEAAVVVMNHHYETDKSWLCYLAKKGVAYCGVLGPKKRTSRMISELKEDGSWPATLDISSSIYGPAGLDIGSESPEQIALAILAEIQAVKAGRSGGFLKDKQSSIHAG